MAIRLKALLARVTALKMAPAATYSKHFIVSDWQGLCPNPLLVAIHTALYGRTYSLCNLSRTPPSCDDAASVSNADLLRPSTTSSLGRCSYTDDKFNNRRGSSRGRRVSRDPCEVPQNEGQNSWTRVPDPCIYNEVDEKATARLRACYERMRSKLRRRSRYKKGRSQQGRRRRRRRRPQRKPRKRGSGGMNRRKCGKPASGPPLPKR